MAYFQTQRFRKTLLAGMASSLAIMAPPPGALAQDNRSAAVAQSFNLPAGPLGDAFFAITTAFDVNIIADERLIQGKIAPAVSGAATAEAALTRVLAGSGLSADRSASGAFVIARQAATQAPDVSEATGRRAAQEEASVADMITVLGRRETGYMSRRQSGGTFGEQSIFDTPFSVTVIPQEFLLDQQVRSLGDIVRNDPSMLVTASPGLFDTVSIRGYGLSNASSYRRESVIFQNQAQSPFENKAAVEIVKGPTSVRYGFTPPGGVVNYVLKRPTDEPYRFAQAFGDTNGSYGIHLDVGGRINDELGFRFNGVASRESTFVDGIDGPRQMFSALFEWTPTDRLRVDVEGEYQYRELEEQPRIRVSSFDASLTPDERADLLERFDPTRFIGQDWGTYPTSTYVGSLGVQYDFSSDWRLHGRVQKMRLVRDQQAGTIAAGSLQANGDFTQGTYFDPSQIRDPLSAEVFVTGRFDTFGVGHDVAFGGAVSRNPIHFSLAGDCCLEAGTSNIFNPVDLPRPPVTATPTVDALYFNQEAVFVSNLVTVTDNLTLFGAVRWSRQENRDRFNAEAVLETTYEDSIFAPNLGVIYNPTDTVTLYGSYSQGITTGAQIPPDAANFGLNDELFLDPAETEQFEAGIKAALFKGAIFTAAYFDISQPLATLDENNVFGYLGDQNHRGVEVNLAGDITDNLRIIAGGLYLDAEIADPGDPNVDGNRPSATPELQFNFFADYAVPFVEGLALNGGVFFTGDRFADNLTTFKADGYVRVDLGVRYRFDVGDQRLTARLNVRNVADADFVEGADFGSFFFGSPRAAFFSLATEF